MTGTYVVGNTSVALGSDEALFTWSDKLQEGNLTFTVFDENGNPVTDYPGLEVFSPYNFDPKATTTTLDDMVSSIENLRPSYTPPDPVPDQYFQAAIQDGRLQVSINQAAYPDYTFAITADTTGLAAALGLNTFFTGDNAESIAVNDALGANLNLINSGRLNTYGDINPGDNQTAREIAALSAKAVSIATIWNKSTSQPLTEYYGTLVARVGSATSGAKYTAASETAIAQDLYDRQEEIRGVNLDEEMANLIKFQASYKAAAKLITTADEMLQTLLSLKQ
jgi:flagellar hook-associated protein 1 FlgK